ncbi:hypothetical protein L5515_008553 [Caenorhabditis briggsae]|uniref:Seven TM Receptor n=1 Tax=Caenorhabditis briggsae TaxID=6238 RepID=A0AAE9JNW1_CAEBR|nr:hypothetical protein L5515_008553 [Caenorhabditis briggsae]
MSSKFLLNLAIHTSGIGFLISLLSEILLLMLIVYKSRDSFGYYKNLMIVYNVVLIMYSIATSNANLAAHSTETSYVLFRMYNGPNRTIGPLLILQFCTMYVTMLIILSVHFIYRYVAVFYHRMLWIFSKFYLALWVLGSFTLGLFLISLKYFFLGEFDYFTDELREVFKNNYNLTMDQVIYNGPIYYICDDKGECTKPLGVWLTMLALCSCFVICLGVMGYFGTRCFYRLSQIKTELSEHTRKMQKQLLFALVIQAGIPIVIMYTPTALLLVSPIVGISFGAYSNIAVSMVAVYPPIDQLAIIWIIRDYRNAIKSK